MTANTAPSLGITIAYWLHMLATVVWIGGLAALSLFVLPAARKALDAGAFSALLAQLRGRLQQAGWFSLAVLSVTGLFQMSAHPAYEGFMAVNNSWAIAIFSKHVVIGLMILTSAYLTWGLLPALQRAALLRAVGRSTDPGQDERMIRREEWLLRVNLLLSVLVLALTAWARTSG